MTSHPTPRVLLGLTIIAAACVLAACGGSSSPSPSASSTSTSSTSTSAYAAGNLLVARSVYDPALVVSGALPYDATPEASTPVSTVSAVTPGTFPNVFTNDTNDADFGVTTSMYLDQWSPAATSPSQATNITAAAAALATPENFSVSFASQSGMGLNV
jgi:hypothetical protein